MDQDPGVRQREAFALGTGAEQERAHRRRLPHADGGDGRLDVLHRVVDGDARRHRAAGGVDVELDVLVGILGLQEEHLGDDQVGDLVLDVGREEDDPLLEEPGEDVVRPLPARGLFDHHRNQSHPAPPCHLSQDPLFRILATVNVYPTASVGSRTTHEHFYADRELVPTGYVRRKGGCNSIALARAISRATPVVAHTPPPLLGTARPANHPAGALPAHARIQHVCDEPGCALPTTSRVTPTHILSTFSQLSTGVRIARRDAVSRARSPKTTVYPSTTGATPKCRLFDRVARAQRRADRHLMRANQVLTSPIVCS